jgi:hypothetical protein
MRIGFASIFSYRPHVEHLVYVANLAREAGHEVRFLTCDAQLPYCYTLALKQRGAWSECPKCIAGGLRSYTAQVQRLPVASSAFDQRARSWAESSAYTVLRIETRAETHSDEFVQLRDRLALGAWRAYTATGRWIESERLDAIVCFNGRMDATRGVCEAAAATSIPYLTVERTWFGDGLQFAINNNALDLSQLDRLNAEYRDAALSRSQARRVARHLAARLLGRNINEWRAYNRSATTASWPAAGGDGPRVLILPGSRNEVEGHPHWRIGWAELTDGIDAVLTAIGAQAADAVLRCHPNWGEPIGRRTGASSERYYSNWARRRGVHVIASRDKASTFDLMRQADIVLVTGGSAAFEASCLGKPVISLTPSTYRTAGIAITVTSNDELEALKGPLPAGEQQIRRGLRYAYTHIYRFSQYVEYVQALTTTRYRYFSGADPVRIERMIATGLIEPDDPRVAADADGENEVVAQVAGRDWSNLIDAGEPPAQRTESCVRRRRALRWIDFVRELLPKGDR